MPYYKFGGHGKTYDFRSFREAVHDARHDHERSLTVGLDAIGYLDSVVIRELILGLRALRDIGGNIYLHVTDQRLLAELRATGLDRVFPIQA